jgi:hypothetical protein
MRMPQAWQSFPRRSHFCAIVIPAKAGIHSAKQMSYLRIGFPLSRE